MAEVESFELITSVRYDTTRPWLPSLLASFPRGLDSLSLTSSDDTQLQMESPIFLVTYHRDRLAEAATAFGWSEATKKLKGTKCAKDIQDLAEEAIRKHQDSSGSTTAQSWKVCTSKLDI